MPTSDAVIRVVIADDSTAWRHLIRSLLDPYEVDVVGEASDGQSAVEVTRATRPDVVLLDVEMPGVSGLEALEIIREEHPTARVVLFSAEERRREAALSRGADGWYLKGADPEQLLAAIGLE